jgi:hypothetical protein
MQKPPKQGTRLAPKERHRKLCEMVPNRNPTYARRSNRGERKEGSAGTKTETVNPIFSFSFSKLPAAKTNFFLLMAIKDRFSLGVLNFTISKEF